MPSAIIVHAAVFTTGALLGGGIAAAISNKSKSASAPSPPIVGLDASGNASMSAQLTVPPRFPSPVLKYGNPGQSLLVYILNHIFIPSRTGPIADTLIRKAYVAGYDRRLRHPAWVHVSLVRLLMFSLLILV